MVSDRLSRDDRRAGAADQKIDRPNSSTSVGLRCRRRRPNSWDFLEFDIDQGGWPRSVSERRAQPSSKPCDSTKGATNGKSGTI
jgi:hypothetical protein